ncbi:MAG: adenylate/guanylate cyclase domain-containing protein [Actinobacteria bacterium]|nr:adenylate/guanylate cyclase domain-containing protein [Actinomycetota bacterium]
MPETQYARSGDVSIAYQVVGEGDHDIVLVPGFVSNVELSWQNTRYVEFYERLAAVGRLILFDKRGTGLSDRVSGIAGLETRMDDVRAVMDAAGSERAALFGISEGGPMTVLFAATYPERTTAAVLYGSNGPRLIWTQETPWHRPREESLRRIEAAERRWGTYDAAKEAVANWVAPSLAGDEEFVSWWATYTRMSASPGAVAALHRMNLEIDIRHVLPAVRVPMLVIHRTGDAIPVEGARYLATHIPGAELLELAGVDHAYFVDPEAILDPTIKFLRRIWAEGGWAEDPDRVLATVLFTDIVGSTARAAELGDRAWRGLVEDHHALVRGQLARHRGREIDTAGDGFFASFDGPARAIRCASAISEGVRTLGLEVRAGLHTGECEVVDGKVGGIAVAIGARVAAQASPGEVLVSSTVKDLVAGSGIAFEDRGAAELKGVPGEWRLFAVA